MEMELPFLFHHTEDVSQSSEGMKTRFKDLDVNRVGGQKFDAEAKKREKIVPRREMSHLHSEPLPDPIS